MAIPMEWKHMNEPVIQCPTCRTEIKLTESLAAPLIAQSRRQFEQTLAAKDAEVAKREAALKTKEGELAAAKASVDEQVAVIGSSNMDIRSFQLDLELMLMVCDRGFVDQMRKVEDGDRHVSRELTRDEWDRRSRFHRLVDDLTRLTSAVQ